VLSNFVISHTQGQWVVRSNSIKWVHLTLVAGRIPSLTPGNNDCTSWNRDLSCWSLELMN